MSLFTSLRPLPQSPLLSAVGKRVKLQHLNNEFWQNRYWERYVSGDYLSDLTDVVKANALLSWTNDNWRTFSAADAQKWLGDIIKWMNKIEEESCDIVEQRNNEHLVQVQSALLETKKIFLNAWVQIAITCLLRSEKLQEIVHHADNISIFYYQQSTERSAKMMFFSGLQVEIAPFLQNICITTEEYVDLSQVKDVLHKYPPGSVFEVTKQKGASEAINLESLTLGDILLAKKTTKKFNVKKITAAKQPKRKTANNVDAAQPINRGKPNSKKVIYWPNNSPPKMPKKVEKRKDLQTAWYIQIERMKKKETKEEKMNAPLLGEVATLWQSPEEKVEGRPLTESQVDFDEEGFLGRVFHLRCYRTSTRVQQNGAWLQHTDSELEEVDSLDRQLTLNIGLKVPVEDVFVGTAAPVVAFFDEEACTWVKDVHATNAHYDMNTSIVHVKISKLGRISLFQRTNFHFPYRKWSLEISANNVSLMISTNFVELTFLFYQQTISVDVGSGIEFSKLKLINRKPFSLPEMARKLLGYGIYIFPSEKILQKQFSSQAKNEELEEYVYRYVCTNGITCCNNNLNSTLPNNTVAINVGEISVQFVRLTHGSYGISDGESMLVLNLAKRSVRDQEISSLFRWMMLTRIISITK